MSTQDYLDDLQRKLTASIEKCMLPRESGEMLNETENIMLNYNVLCACRDLLLLSRIYETENQEQNVESVQYNEKSSVYCEQLCSDEQIDYSNVCADTQLLNSLNAMLISPFQLVDNKIKRNKNMYHIYNYSEKQWREKFPVFSKYIFDASSINAEYVSCWFCLDKTIGKVEKENQYNPIYVIKHLHNALLHNRMTVEQINQSKEIGRIHFVDKENVFLDEGEISPEFIDDFLKNFPRYDGENYINKFRLTIKYEDLETILYEIFRFLNEILRGSYETKE